MLRSCARASAIAARREGAPTARRVPPRACVLPALGLLQHPRLFSAGTAQQAGNEFGDKQHAERIKTLDIEGLSAESLKPGTTLEIAFPPSSKGFIRSIRPAALKLKFPDSGEFKGINPSIATGVPMITLTGDFVEGDKFTVIMTDPDAPSRESAAFREFIHYAVVDAPLLPDNTLSLADGAQAIPWVQPAPPCKSGFHRYIFLVYAHQEGVSGMAVYAGLTERLGDRGGKRAALAAKELGLGDPVAYGGFMAEWDSSCDECHEKIGFLPPPGMRSPKQVEKHGDE